MTRVFGPINLLLVALFLWTAGSHAAEVSRTVGTGPPYRVVQAEPPILPPGGPGAATDLQVEARCSDMKLRTAIAKFSWAAAQSPGTRQRVDITMFREGFRDGKFETVALLPLRQSSVEWEEGEAGINYYWRVLTLTSQGWVPSETARYQAPVCPADMQPEAERPR